MTTITDAGTPPLRRIVHGLVAVAVGTLVVLLVWLLVVVAALTRGGWFYDSRYVILSTLGLGLVIAFAGRCFSLAVPPQARAARAWGVLAAVIDGCGLLSGITTFIVAQSGVWLGPVAGIGATLFSLGGLLLGRTAFHFYLRALAKFVGDPVMAMRAVTVFLHAVAVAGGAVLGSWWLSYSNSGPDAVRGWMVIVTLALLHWSWRYFRLLSAVGTAARAYHPLPLEANDDPDREYRLRYEQGLTAADPEGEPRPGEWNTPSPPPTGVP